MRKLVDAIKEKLMKDFKPTKANYERYVAAMRRAIDEGINDVRKQRRALNARKEKAQKGLENLVVGAMGFRKAEDGKPRLDATEEKVYERRKFELESEIEECKETLEKLQQEGLLKTFDYEEFSNFLRNAHQKWEDASPQQKHALARFLFSNIKIGDGKVLELAYNSIIEDLFVSSGGSGGT